eukprot:CAMPEP_0175764680 /NCGR_PEP_ID=MMETSP0097-20121207/68407_1 /TAXON_ID=311494 /ORGANISM="Alexandrium monilatum, Strain CCMP3105" /LENGTH=158 /DNA_ID=CAMNT_0017074507 /DNA_START=207 /DNA_END=680 /DNA_ORIENTATION=+
MAGRALARVPDVLAVAIEWHPKGLPVACNVHNGVVRPGGDAHQGQQQLQRKDAPLQRPYLVLLVPVVQPTDVQRNGDDEQASGTSEAPKRSMSSTKKGTICARSQQSAVQTVTVRPHELQPRQEVSLTPSGSQALWAERQKTTPLIRKVISMCSSRQA